MRLAWTSRLGVINRKALACAHFPFQRRTSAGKLLTGLVAGSPQRHKLRDEIEHSQQGVETSINEPRTLGPAYTKISIRNKWRAPILRLITCFLQPVRLIILTTLDLRGWYSNYWV